MSAKPKEAARPAGRWRTELLRVTAFPSASAEASDPNWWEALVGEAPEGVTQQPKKGGVRVEGPWKDSQLVLGIQPMRIDWGLVSAPEAQGLPSSPFSDLGNFVEVKEAFVGLMGKWITTKAPPLIRLAFGAVLFDPVGSLQEGYKGLEPLLPAVRVDQEGATDFLYQINRRRPSKVISALEVNRLSKWSVMAANFVEVAVSQGKPQYKQGKPSYALRLELDVNSAPDYEGELQADQVGALLKELVELAQEIAERGDIA